MCDEQRPALGEPLRTRRRGLAQGDVRVRAGDAGEVGDARIVDGESEDGRHRRHDGVAEGGGPFPAAAGIAGGEQHAIGAQDFAAVHVQFEAVLVVREIVDARIGAQTHAGFACGVGQAIDDVGRIVTDGKDAPIAFGF